MDNSIVFGQFNKINPDQKTWFHNGRPVYYFKITMGSNDTVCYALHPVRTHYDIAYVKQFCDRYEGKHAVVFVAPTLVKKDICLKIIARGLKELGVINEENE